MDTLEIIMQKFPDYQGLPTIQVNSCTEATRLHWYYDYVDCQHFQMFTLIIFTVLPVLYLRIRMYMYVYHAYI